MKVVLWILLLILCCPVFFVLVMTEISMWYMDYLHNKPDPTKEEWKLKR